MTLYLIELNPISKIIFKKPISFEGGKDHIALSYDFPPYNTIAGAIAYKIVQKTKKQTSDRNLKAEDVLRRHFVKIISYGYYIGEDILVPTPKSAGMKKIKVGEEYLLVPQKVKKEKKKLNFVRVGDIVCPYEVKSGSGTVEYTPFLREHRPGVGLTNEKTSKEGWLYIAEYLIFPHIKKEKTIEHSGIWILVETKKDLEELGIDEDEIVYIGGKGGASLVESVKETRTKEITCEGTYWAVSITYSIFKNGSTYYDAPVEKVLLKAVTGIEILSSVHLQNMSKIVSRWRDIAVMPGSCYLVPDSSLGCLYFDQACRRLYLPLSCAVQNKAQQSL